MSAPYVVDAEEIAAVEALEVPLHPRSNFDAAAFISMIARLFSLTLEAKREIVACVATFSQTQVDELFRIMAHEREKFAELNDQVAKRLAASSEGAGPSRSEAIDDIERLSSAGRNRS